MRRNNETESNMREIYASFPRHFSLVLRYWIKLSVAGDEKYVTRFNVSLPTGEIVRRVRLHLLCLKVLWHGCGWGHYEPQYDPLRTQGRKEKL